MLILGIQRQGEQTALPPFKAMLGAVCSFNLSAALTGKAVNDLFKHVLLR